MNDHVRFNGSPTVDGYYTTLDTSEVNREGVSDIPVSGDFSLANIDISGFRESVRGPFIGTKDSLEFAAYACTDHSQLILYKGAAIIFASDVSAFNGAITHLGGSDYLVTGDCSITVEYTEAN